jgi:hypothetical protein
MNDSLERKLMALHKQNQPDADFSDRLERELVSLHRAGVSRRSTQVKHIARAAAAIVIVIGLFATVAPLRSLAEEILRFFVPGQGYVLPGDEAAYSDAVAVTTIEEAEAIAGFEALQWHGGGFNILAISAAPGYLHIAYERENDRGALMHVTKWRTDTRPEQTPIEAGVEIIQTSIDGVPAQFVAGAWFGEDPAWEADHYRQLRWTFGDFSYHLRVASPIARTREETVSIAESLQ